MPAVKEQPQEPSSESLAAGYEISTINVKALAIFFVCLVLTAGMIFVADWYLFLGYIKFDERADRPFSALTDSDVINQHNQSHGTHLSTAAIPLPPPPRVQPTAPDHNLPEDDLRNMYRSENEVFDKMGWGTSPDASFELRIPDQLMTAVIQQESQRQHTEKK